MSESKREGRAVSLFWGQLFDRTLCVFFVTFLKLIATVFSEINLEISDEMY